LSSIEDRLLFVIGPPRSGSTLLMRMLSSHSAIYSRPEPHVFGPLAHLGYFDTVEKAPYDQFQAADAMRALVAELRGGEQDYVDACRAYVDILYGRLLAARGGGKRFFLDKTPANALVLPFITRLYPQARYVVLTRHPAAVFSSFANSFFDGDYEAAHRFNPILERYVPAMARLLREASVPLVQVGYEQLVSDPEGEMRRVCGLLGLDFEPGMIEYGRQEFAGKGLGDPITVDRESRPVTTSVEKWAGELAADPAKLRLVRAMIDRLDPRDLETWGFPPATLFAPLERAAAVAGKQLPKPRGLDRFRFERKLLVWLRRDIQTSAFGRVVRRLRTLCDILLRG
jgi:hypothetical protein